MTLLRLFFLALGLALLGYVIVDAELAEVWNQAAAFGAAGTTVILALYAVEFLADVAGWHVTFRTIALTSIWLRRLYLVRMVGEAFNAVTPVASMGGEPVKVMLLKKYYGVPYGDASASVVLAKTTNLMALVVFLAGGFGLMLADDRFSAAHVVAGASGLTLFTAIVAAFFLFQRLRLPSRGGVWLSRLHLGARLEDYLHHIERFEDRLVDFYSRRRQRFSAALALALGNWFVGALGVYYTLYFLDTPVSFMEAWVIEAFAQLVRAGTFFIPASIGAQEGAFVLVCAVLTGSPSAGLAAALVRRMREIVWILGGLALGWRYAFRPALETRNRTRGEPGPY